MIPDITPPVGVWFDFYALTGFAVGTRLLIQNKGGGKAMIWEGANPPSGTTEAMASGVELTSRGAAAKTTPGIAGCWGICWETSFKANGRFSVQEYTS